MGKGRISEEGKRIIRQRMATTAHGLCAAAADDLAARFGVCRATIYRHADRHGASRPRAGRADYRAWVDHVVALAHRSTPAAALDLALESAVAAGDLPAAALAMSTGTLYNIAREMGYRPARRRTQRLHADWPLQAVQVDGSTSQYLTPLEQQDDGDWILKIHRGPVSPNGYKNKPLAAHRMRLMVYGIWDMATGLSRACYMPGLGENSLDFITALIQMLLETGDPLRPLAGVPENIWPDQGVLVKSNATRNLLSRLGTAVITGAPHNKERQGGIERSWRTLWSRFERALLLEDRITITLSELHQRLIEFERRQGALSARTRVAGRIVTRAEAWTALMNRRPADQPLRKMPANALATLYREDQRKLNRNGILSWDKTEYECAAWHSRTVIVRQPLDGSDELTLECPVTGNRTTARPYSPRRYGNVRGQMKSPLDHLLDRAQPVGGAVYGDSPHPAPSAGNIIPLQAKPGAAQEIDNPLDAARFATMADALAAFRALYPYPLGEADLAAVTGHIDSQRLSRVAVSDLAGDLLAQLTTTTR